MRRLAFILLAAHASLALAADWVRLAIPHSEDPYFYDRSKLVVGSNEITYWKKALFKPSCSGENTTCQLSFDARVSLVRQDARIRQQ